MPAGFDLTRATANERAAWQAGYDEGTKFQTKPGWKTTGFWLTAYGALYAGLFGMIVLLRQDIELERALTVLGAVAAAVGGGAFYTRQRTMVQTGETKT